MNRSLPSLPTPFSRVGEIAKWSQLVVNSRIAPRTSKVTVEHRDRDCPGIAFLAVFIVMELLSLDSSGPGVAVSIRAVDRERGKIKNSCATIFRNRQAQKVSRLSDQLRSKRKP